MHTPGSSPDRSEWTGPSDDASLIETLDKAGGGVPENLCGPVGGKSGLQLGNKALKDV